MQPSRKKYARVEREEETVVHEDENAHLWAVSYSDFLMALLSFFILFFSMDKDKKESVLMNLTDSFTSAGAVASNGTGTGTGNGLSKGVAGGSIREMKEKEEEQINARRIPASVFKDMSNLEVSVDKDKQNIIINFPNDIYEPGKHTFQIQGSKTLTTFLTLIKPYDKKVKIYFEGHADNTPLKVHKNSIVTDNFVLSSLRATSALNIARDLGFTEKKLFIQAASSNTRNSRSLSIRIEPLEEGDL